MVEKNIMYQQLQKICRKQVCPIKVFMAESKLLFAPKKLLVPTPRLSGYMEICLYANQTC